MNKISTGNLGANTWAMTIIDAIQSAELIPRIKTYHNGTYVDGERPTGMHRPFIGWDGEGYDTFVCDSDGQIVKRHYYCLFGNSEGQLIKGRSLSTLAIFELMLSARQKHPFGIHVGFAFEYDVNMILGDCPRRVLEKLQDRGVAVWRKYRIEHRKRKWFQLSRKEGKGRLAIRIYDIFTFFNKSFVAACDEYLGQSRELDDIAAGKAKRGSFTLSSLETDVIVYWRVEIAHLVKLARALRESLYRAGIQLSVWHGPGAVATAVFTQHKVSSHMSERLRDGTLAAVRDASRRAFYAGRFELFRAGHYVGPVYSADLNSAWPYCMSVLPSLSDGEWEYITDPDLMRTIPTKLGFYHIKYNGSDQFRKAMRGFPMPLPFRDADARVHFPLVTDGWYHADEAFVVARDEKRAQFVEAWIYHDTGIKPFAYIPDMYTTRKQYKRDGNPAQYALKIGLNSGYGKTAQRIGWNRKTLEPPRYHQLEWAGFITAMCRAMIYAAMLAHARDGSLIAVETDGFYTTRPIEWAPRGFGSGLGEWEASEYDGITIVQNGVYWLKKGDEWLPPKTRGIPRASMDHARALYCLQQNEPILAEHNSFVGYGGALHSDWETWRTWQTRPREFVFGGDGKRRHVPSLCVACLNGQSYGEGLHTLALGFPHGGESSPHYLPWIDPLNMDIEEIALKDLIDDAETIRQ